MTCHEIEVIGAKPLTFDFKNNLTENTVNDSNLVHNVSNHLKTSPEWQGKKAWSVTCKAMDVQHS